MTTQKYSQNGWPAEDTTAQFVSGTVAGFSFWAANHSVLILATALIEAFNTEVEPIAGKVLDDWSWAYRDVRDSTTTITNHASATAWDLNATRHPRGVKGTFTAKQVTALRKILAGIVTPSGLRVFRWGGDFTTTVDEMHFEIAVNPTQAAQAARLELQKQETKTMALDLSTEVELTAAAAAQMSLSGTPRKAGDKVSLSYILQWGGAGLDRVDNKIDLLTAKVDQLLAASKQT